MDGVSFSVLATDCAPFAAAACRAPKIPLEPDDRTIACRPDPGCAGL